MDDATEAKPGLFSIAKRLLNIALATAENRLELFLVEAREERLRLFNALLLLCAFVGFAFMALLLVSLTLVVVFWDSARVAVLVALSAVYCLAALGIFWRLQVRFKNWPTFGSSLQEFKKDRACLEKEN